MGCLWKEHSRVVPINLDISKACAACTRATATKFAAHVPIERALPSFAPEAIFEVADTTNSRSEIGELDR
jgi:hypothetical protein